MKKLIILAALAFGAYKLLGQGNTATPAAGGGSQPDQEPVLDAEVIDPQVNYDNLARLYDGQVKADAKGYWMYFTDGKVYSTSTAFWQKFAAEHPGYVVETLPFDVWEFLASNQSPLIGGEI